MSNELFKAVNNIALAMLKNAASGDDLAIQMIRALNAVEQAGRSIDTAWATLADTNGWADKAAGIEGDTFPKTLANYRSLSRKAVLLKVGHAFGKYSDWTKAIRAADKLDKQAKAELTPVIESFNLNEETELPAYLEAFLEMRGRMDEANSLAFDKYLQHHIAAFKPVKEKVKA